MDAPPDPATMTDQQLLREWECIDCETAEDVDRSGALAAELEKRGLDV